jgi:hypothetical protein
MEFDPAGAKAPDGEIPSEIKAMDVLNFIVN